MMISFRRDYHHDALFLIQQKFQLVHDVLGGILDDYQRAA